MRKKLKMVDISEDIVVEPTIVEENVSPEPYSEEKIKFIKMVEDYKQQNPAKYLLKEESFIKKINSMK